MNPRNIKVPTYSCVRARTINSTCFFLFFLGGEGGVDILWRMVVTGVLLFNVLYFSIVILNNATNMYLVEAVHCHSWRIDAQHLFSFLF